MPVKQKANLDGDKKARKEKEAPVCQEEKIRQVLIILKWRLRALVNGKKKEAAKTRSSTFVQQQARQTVQFRLCVFYAYIHFTFGRL